MDLLYLIFKLIKMRYNIYYFSMFKNKNYIIFQYFLFFTFNNIHD